MTSSEHMSGNIPDLVPRPDPSRRTTAALEREITAVREHLEMVANGLRELADTQDQVRDERLKGVDGRIDALKEVLNKDVDLVRAEAVAQYEIRDLRFELIEKQRVELKVDNEKALAVNLGTARESLNNLATTYHTGHAALVGVVDDVKQRMTALEARAASGKESSSKMIAIISVTLTLVYLVASVVLTLFVH